MEKNNNNQVIFHFAFPKIGFSLAVYRVVLCSAKVLFMLLNQKCIFTIMVRSGSPWWGSLEFQDRYP